MDWRGDCNDHDQAPRRLRPSPAQKGKPSAYRQPQRRAKLPTNNFCQTESGAFTRSDPNNINRVYSGGNNDHSPRRGTKKISSHTIYKKLLK